MIDPCNIAFSVYFTFAKSSKFTLSQETRFFDPHKTIFYSRKAGWYRKTRVSVGESKTAKIVNDQIFIKRTILTAAIQ
jgi:hypothetical protein